MFGFQAVEGMDKRGLMIKDVRAKGIGKDHHWSQAICAVPIRP